MVKRITTPTILIKDDDIIVSQNESGLTSMDLYRIFFEFVTCVYENPMFYTSVINKNLQSLYSAMDYIDYQTSSNSKKTDVRDRIELLATAYEAYCIIDTDLTYERALIAAKSFFREYSGNALMNFATNAKLIEGGEPVENTTDKRVSFCIDLIAHLIIIFSKKDITRFDEAALADDTKSVMSAFIKVKNHMEGGKGG